MMGVNNMTRMRLGGLNSGTDVEAMVRAMGMSARQRINNNQRRVLQLQAQQNAYREVITRLQNFQRSFFDNLNMSNNLRSQAVFSQMRPTVFTNNIEGAPSGVSVTSSPGAAAATYNVELITNASQSRLIGGQVQPQAGADLTTTLAALGDGDVYNVSVRVGDTTRLLTVTGGADIAATRESFNEALLVFGRNNQNTGMVSIGADNRITTGNSQAISMSKFVQQDNEFTFNFDPANVNTGVSTITINIGSQTQSINIETIDTNHFARLFRTNGTIVSGNIQDHIDYINDNRPAGSPLFTRAEFDTLLDEYNTFVNAQYRANFDVWRADAGGRDTTTGVFENAEREAIFRESARVSLQASRPAWDAYFAADNQGFANVDAMIAAARGNPGGTPPVAPNDTLLANFDNFAWNTYAAQNDRQNLLRNSFAGNEFNQFQLHAHAAGNPALMTAAQFRTHTTTLTGLRAEIAVSNRRSLDQAINTVVEANWANDVRVEVSRTGNAVTLTPARALPGDPPPVPPTQPAPDVMFSVTATGVNNFGLVEHTLQQMTFAGGATLSSLEGFDVSQTLAINGRNIALRADMTLSELAQAVNNSGAGVNMTFSSITNRFTITANQAGADGAINFTGTALGALGLFESTPANTIDRSDTTAFNNPNLEGFRRGTNLEITVNGAPVETAGNTFTVDGTTFTFEPHAAEGSFRVEVGRNPQGAASIIRDFVEAYNSMVRDISLGMLQERRSTGHHFLTDWDIEQMEMSDRQVEQWNTMANRGLLFRNQTVSSVMGGLRNAMMTEVIAPNGVRFGLHSIMGNDGTRAILTSVDPRNMGQLELNEAALMEALERDPESIMALFTSENGLMSRIQREVHRATNTMGAEHTHGSLIRRAGLATGLTAQSNALHSRITSLNEMITTLEARYERQQERFWRQFTAMERQFATMNAQSDQINGFFMGLFA
jgi:flagellar capping protein FliD